MKATDSRQTQPNAPRRIRRDSLPIYEHRRFRCPECESLRFTMRSHLDDDGISTQDRTCLDCGYRFVLIVE